ncbi:hypothetical protein KKG31_07975 [Patescibacteria group bacterium]|nr:hypothetical protein [Patescibacteria group bacterium]MBU1759002.1 hypothetical protein [Patescibacteria group bacterium]
MRRNYNKKTLKEVIEEINKRRNYPSIGADIIVGFPGETEADFQQTLD